MWSDPSGGGSVSGGGRTTTTTTTLHYDGDGGRVKKTVDDGSLITWTTYIGKLYVCEGTAPPLSCAKMIFSGSQRIAIKQVGSGSTSYFHPDHLGSTSVLTDSNGVSEQDVTYYPYGETRSSTGTTDIAYKYTGKEQDNSTGLYFYEARYYDPVLGRFISADTIVPSVTDPQALNRYSYARNNPIIFNDPSGHFFKKALRKIGKAFNSPIFRGIAWATFPGLAMYLDPYTSNTAFSLSAGVGGNYLCGPICGGAASGAVGAYLSGGNIGKGAAIGAAVGAVSFGTGYWANQATQGEYVLASAFIGGAAGAATGAALNGGGTMQTVQASLIQGSVAAVATYIQINSQVSPEQAQQAAQEAKNASALNPDQGKQILLAQRAPGARSERLINPMEPIEGNLQLKSDIATINRNVFSYPQGKSQIQSHPDFPRLSGSNPLRLKGGILIDRGNGGLEGIFIDRHSPVINRSKTQLIPYGETVIRPPNSRGR